MDAQPKQVIQVLLVIGIVTLLGFGAQKYFRLGLREHLRENVENSTDKEAEEFRQELFGNVYIGRAQGYDGPIHVEVRVKDSKVTSVRVVEHRESRGDAAIQTLPDRIVMNNGVDGVDAVTGATVTSHGIFDAVRDGLAKAK